MNVLSLFDGISCGLVALERAGIKVDNYFASEINKDSITVTLSNYPNTIQLGDVCLLDESKLRELPKIDILIGGSPCLDLSRANSNGRGLDGARSGLFYQYISIRNWLIEHNNPNLLFLLENVKPKKDALDIINAETKVTPVIIDSALVSALRRVRYYWTNINGGVIPLPEDKGILIKDVIYDNNYKQFTDARIENSKVFTPNYIKWDLSGKGYYSQQDRAYYLDGKMCTVPKARASDKLNIWLGGNLYRKGHPVEAERYLTLPDNYTNCIKSNNKRIDLCGDGWTVDVIAHIFSFIKK